mmetsp:Transcript_6854/g.7880  ORF Transcript_6854/g.7880 Transcript_6854/m.7880 type:complete len:436 (+) Transcript_6854:337-1644(+)
MAAQSPKQTASPIILVSGFLGLSNENWTNRYWGEALSLGSEESPVFAAPVSSVASAYDRACEIFAFLVGTVVDYGEEHARKYGHSRFGKDFTSQGVHKSWSQKRPIHLVGHSFGGNTVRVFAYLVAKDHFGYGTNIRWIKSMTTISAPLQGSLLTYVLGACEDHDTYQPVRMFSPGYLLGLSAHFLELATRNLGMKDYIDVGLDHWQLPEQGLKGWLKAVFGGHNGGGTPAVCSRDNAAHDMTIVAANEWNRLIEKEISENEVFEFHIVAGKSTTDFSIKECLAEHFHSTKREPATVKQEEKGKPNPFYWPLILLTRDVFTFAGAKSVSSKPFTVLQNVLCPIKTGIHDRLSAQSDGLCSTFSQHLLRKTEHRSSEKRVEQFMCMQDLKQQSLKCGRYAVKVESMSHFGIVPFPNDSGSQFQFFLDLFTILKQLE